jgi:two-component system cell cycle sensor histidine kinase/response regulator CckA
MAKATILLLALLMATTPQQKSHRCVSVTRAQVTVAALRDTRCSDGRRAYLGDTVIIAGRVTMGTGDLSRRVLHIVVQDSSGGITVVGPTGSGPWVLGDSVVVRGVLVSVRDALALDGRSVSRVGGSRAPQAAESIALSRDALARADGKFVRLAGRVVGRGGDPPREQLYLVGREDTVMTVTVEGLSDGAHNLHLERFEAGDVVTVTGALLGQRSDRDSTQRTYQLFPLGSAALAHVGTSRASRRSLLMAGTLLLLALIAILLEARRRAAGSRRTLTAQREWFEALTDHASEYVLVLDERRRVTFASRSVERILGVTPEELIGVDSLQNKTEADRAALAAAFERVLEHPGEPAVAEFRVRHRDGRLVTLSGSARNLLSNPAVEGIVVNVHDISAERRVEAALHDAERESREILDALPVMVYSVEPFPPFKPLYVSRGHETLGFSRDNWMMPGLWEQLIHPEDRDRVLAAVTLARERNEELNCEYRVLDKQGLVRWVVDRGRFTDDADGRPASWRGVITDVTSSHDAERALRESEERYRELFNEDVAGNFVSSPSGRLIACNEQLARLFGFATVADALRADLRDLYETPDARDEFLRRLRRDGKLSMQELRLRRIDGTIVIVLENARAQLDQFGEIAEIRGHLLDITERRRLESELRQAQKMEMVGRLAGGIAHDFNNLLGIIGNYAAVLRDDLSENNPHRSDLDEIVRAVGRGASLTRQLLTFSRERLPTVTLVDVDAAIGNADRMLRRLLGPEIRLTLDLHADGAEVRMDPGHTDQILVNLLLNAADAMPEGGAVVITTARVSMPAPAAIRATSDMQDSPQCGDYVRIAVRDAGCGMDAETVRRATDPFFTTKELGHGTGLGLSSVYGIVKTVRGDFMIESTPGSGTTVVIHLPVTCAEIGSDSRELATPLPTLPVVPRATRVLLVDDEPAMLSSLGRILERRLGCKVTAASDGHAALRVWDEHAGEFDLLVTDLRMPGMGGEALIRELRARGSAVRVLIMSGYPEDQSALAGIDDERTRFIEKPYSLGEMVAVVLELLHCP